MTDKEKLYEDIDIIMRHPLSERALFHKVAELMCLYHDDHKKIDSIRSKIYGETQIPTDQIIQFELIKDGEKWSPSCEDKIPRYIIDTIIELSADHEFLLSHLVSSPLGEAKVSFTVHDSDRIVCSVKMPKAAPSSDDSDPKNFKITQNVQEEMLEIVDFCFKNPEFRKYIMRKITRMWKPFVQDNAISG